MVLDRTRWRYISVNIPINNAPVMDALFILKYNYIEKRSDTDYEP